MSEAIVTHETLEQIAEEFLKANLPQVQNGKFTSHAVFWPVETLMSSDGTPINDYVITHGISAEDLQNPMMMRRLAVQTKAFGFVSMTLDPRTGVFELQLESIKGATRWSCKRLKSADTFTVTKPVREDGATSLGVLWRRNMAQA